MREQRQQAPLWRYQTWQEDASGNSECVMASRDRRYDPHSPQGKVTKVSYPFQQVANFAQAPVGSLAGRGMSDDQRAQFKRAFQAYFFG